MAFLPSAKGMASWGWGAQPGLSDVLCWARKTSKGRALVGGPVEDSGVWAGWKP